MLPCCFHAEKKPEATRVYIFLIVTMLSVYRMLTFHFFRSLTSCSLFFDPSHVCLLSFLPFFVQSREHFPTSFYLKLFVHSLIPSLSDDLKICYLRKFTFTRVVFHTFLCCFYLQKMFFQTFSASISISHIEFKILSKTSTQVSFLFQFSVRSDSISSHFRLVDSVMWRSFFSRSTAIFVLVFIFCLCWIGTLIWFFELSSRYISTC